MISLLCVTENWVSNHLLDIDSEALNENKLVQTTQNNLSHVCCIVLKLTCAFLYSTVEFVCCPWSVTGGSLLAVFQYRLQIKTQQMTWLSLKVPWSSATCHFIMSQRMLFQLFPENFCLNLLLVHDRIAVQCVGRQFPHVVLWRNVKHLLCCKKV